MKCTGSNLAGMKHVCFSVNFTLIMLVSISFSACSGQTKTMDKMPEHTNALINEQSPYLLQHAHNPVDWHSWGDEAFEKAEAEQKLVIISIGYSACHWCHVMERETFEDSAAAALMNAHFVSVKIDREEHPDVDQVYMTAVQLMTGSGGWPLNVVTLPDGRPVWGGTYFPKDNWMKTLSNIQELYAEEPEKVLEYATRLTEGVRQSELVEATDQKTNFDKFQASTLFENWKSRFDNKEGGPNRAPKFPLPNNYEYLLQYAHLSGNQEALNQVELTLNKMAWGGIYDQAGGGFARYSTDVLWKAPHFEKMLYDNAQLITLYAKAWQHFKHPLYDKTVQETIEWAKEEMLGEESQFYSALDADSEGEEGKFYVWTEQELKAIIPTHEWEAFNAYYDLKKGKWESEQIILMRNESEQLNLEQEKAWRSKLMEARAKRVRPGLDDKSLTSWNAMMIKALVDANVLSPEKDAYLKQAKRTAKWLLANQNDKESYLRHAFKNGKSYIDGLLEDYAFSIEAFIALYEETGEVAFLTQAEAWLNVLDEDFRDVKSGLYFTRSRKAKKLIAQSIDVTDNVVPSANSVMAKNLFKLGKLLANIEYVSRAEEMLNQLDQERLLSYGESYSNWAQLHLWITYPFYEVALVGKAANTLGKDFSQNYLPNVVMAKTDETSSLALFENRFVEGKSLIYVCQNQVCQLPVEKVSEAMNLLGTPNR
jgi:uncharacterized protein YyaL (SSP411 family)